MNLVNEKIEKVIEIAKEKNKINYKDYPLYNVKRGLRNEDGTGVLAGLTSVGEVRGYIIDDGERVPVEGSLRYRGVDVKNIVAACKQESRFGYEETAFLLLFGFLPDKETLDEFCKVLGELRFLPGSFTEDMIMKAYELGRMKWEACAKELGGMSKSNFYLRYDKWKKGYICRSTRHRLFL